MKKCGLCGITKPHSHMQRQSISKKTGYGGYVTNRCKKCAAQLSKKWKEKHPIRARQSERNAILKKQFGITLIEYEALKLKQENKCAICGQLETQLVYGKPRSLAVDHCHITRQIRGLLCFACNTSLGKFNHNPDLLLKAVNYLKGITNAVNF